MATYGWSDLKILMVNGIPAHNETTSFQINDLRAGVVDTTRIGQTHEERKFDGILSAKFSQVVLYDPVAPTLSDELFNPTTGLLGAAARVASVPIVVALAGDSRGQPFIGMAGMQASVGSRDISKGDVQRVTIDYENVSNYGIGDGKIIDWGNCSAGVSTGYADFGSASTYGGVFHVHLVSYTSTPTQIAVKLQHCTTAGGTYTDVSGATTGTVAVASLPIGFAIPIANGTTLNQYVKAFYTFTGGTAPTVLAFAGLVRKTTAT